MVKNGAVGKNGSLKACKPPDRAGDRVPSQAHGPVGGVLAALLAGRHDPKRVFKRGEPGCKVSRSAGREYMPAA